MKKNTKELIKNLKEFMYDSKLKSLDVYSRQYLQNVFFSEYSDNSKYDNKNPYTVIFGDFNKLNNINKNYGDKAGDEAILTALSLIRDILPSNTKISRIGGDEFLFIAENLNEKDSKKYIKNVQKILNSAKNGPYNLTIEMEGVDSSHTSGIKEMYKTAEKIASDRKNISRSSFSGTPEEILLSKIENGFDNYLTFFRFPDDFNFNTDCIKELLTKTINTTTNLLEKTIQIEKEKQELLNQDSIALSPDKAIEIDKLLNKPRAKTHLNSEDLDSAFKLLTHEPVTKQISRNYLNAVVSHKLNLTTLNEKPSILLALNLNSIKNRLKKILSKEEPYTPRKYNAIFFSTTFMKLSNSENGHLKTDKFLEKIPKEIKNELSSLLSFDDDLVNTKHKNFLIDIGGRKLFNSLQ